MCSLTSDTNVPSGGLSVPKFPSPVFPAEARHSKLLGIYPQRQPGRFMQRVKITGGVLSGGQWRALAAVMQKFTPETPLHLTTRQDIELHDLTEGDIPVVHSLLADAGLTSLGTGGDTLRNIVVCHCCAGGDGATPDLLPLGHAIHRTLSAFDGLYALPRKFKISLSCGRGCGRPFIHDLAFTLANRDGRLGLRVLGAGSLGAKPGLGIDLLDWIEPGEALPFALAAVRMFAQHGDRTNRAKARLRHVRERLGDRAFKAGLLSEYESVKGSQAWAGICLAPSDKTFAAHKTLTFPNGDVTFPAAEALADLAEVPGVSVRIGYDHRVFVFVSGESGRAADQIIHGPSLFQAVQNQPNVVACPGTRWCSRGLADTNALAARLRAALSGKLGERLAVAVSGCPNGCAANAVADIGLFGGRATVDGQTVEKFLLVSGGGKGGTNVLAATVAAGLSADQAVAEATRLAGQLIS